MTDANDAREAAVATGATGATGATAVDALGFCVVATLAAGVAAAVRVVGPGATVAGTADPPIPCLRKKSDGFNCDDLSGGGEFDTALTQSRQTVGLMVALN